MSPYFDSFANNGAQGYPTVDLRGLGPLRTLALVNGRRLAPHPISQAEGGVPSLAVNINQLPSAAIQRIDVHAGRATIVQ